MGLTKYRRPAPSLFRLLNSMPSTICRMSPVLAPCTEMRTDCSPFDPPTSRPLAGDTAPGTRAISPPMLLLVGRASIIALLITCSRVDALDVDERRFAGDRHGFGHRADLQVDVQRRREVRAELDALAPEGGEPGQRVGHRIRARTQFDDPVLPRRVGYRAAHLFNQRRAGRFDRHAGKHRAR